MYLFKQKIKGTLQLVSFFKSESSFTKWIMINKHFGLLHTPLNQFHDNIPFTCTTTLTQHCLLDKVMNQSIL